MGASLALVFVVAGTLQGLEHAMEERVSDFYTDEARIVAGPPGTAPGNPIRWNSEEAMRETLEEVEGDLRMESQFLLSRRGLIQAYLTEDEQFTVGTPGGAGGDGNQYSIGVLIGPEEDGYEGLRPYLTKGSRLPAPRAADDVDREPVQVVMSLQAFEGFLTDREKESLSWPPRFEALRAFSFEITAARIDNDSQYYDIVRYPAVPVGLFDTDLDALDQFSMFTPIEEVRRLLGHDGDAFVGNVITSPNEAAANAFAGQRNWSVDSSESFSQRFIGQMVEIVQFLSFLVTVLLFLIPVFLLWYGLTQQLDRQRRELAVCQALGLQTRALRAGLLKLVLRVMALSLSTLVVVLGAYVLIFNGWIKDWDGSPFPLEFLIPLWLSLGVATLVIVGLALALHWTAKRQSRRDIVATLRAQ